MSGSFPVVVFKFLVLLVLIAVIGFPLWVCEKLTGKQPERVVDWLDRKLSR